MGSSHCFLTSAPGEWARTCETSMLKDPGLQGREINIPFLLRFIIEFPYTEKRAVCLPRAAWLLLVHVLIFMLH